MSYAPKGLKVNYWNWPYPENCVRSDELEEEIANGFVDEFGAVYSKDGKRLLKCADVKNYKIREGTETVEKLGSDTVGTICFWDKPYVPEELDPNESWSDDEVFIDDKDVVYTIDRKRLLYARKGFTDNEYIVPEGTLTICDQSFLCHEGYLILSVPASIKVIGDDIFGKDGGKIVFRGK